MSNDMSIIGINFSVEPGWYADDGDGDCIVYYPDIAAGGDAAREYVADGDYDTGWVRVYVWRQTYLGERVEESAYLIGLPVTEPDCDRGHEHSWEHDSVRGHGGGVICRETCARCGVVRVTDTWATDPGTGTQGLTSRQFVAPSAR